MEPVKTNETTTPVNPLFPVMGIGSLLYALLYTICLYHNPSGISYPFYIGGTACFSASFEGRVHLQILHVRAMLQCSQFPVKESTIVS